MNSLDDTSRRHIPLHGAKNFRDLGGYKTRFGRTVKWGCLYRSDRLHKLTKRDHQRILELGLSRVIDFRATHEVRQEPDRLPLQLHSARVDIPILDSSTRVWYEKPREMVRNLKRLDASSFMLESNMEFATRFTPEMSRFLSEVLSANGRPILFHCAAGKDRTGFAAAILLHILGVDFQTIMEDYLLTNRYIATAHEWNFRLLRLLRGRRFTAGVRAFAEARAEYLVAGFNSIRENYGSFEGYTRDGLGLKAGDVSDLQAAYLDG